MHAFPAQYAIHNDRNIEFDFLYKQLSRADNAVMSGIQICFKNTKCSTFMANRHQQTKTKPHTTVTLSTLNGLERALQH